MKSMFAAFVLASLGLAVPPTVVAGPEEIPWQDSGLGRIGDIAQIDIGELNRFTGSDGTRTFLTMTENIPDGDEVGTMIGMVPGTEEMWFAIFRWNAIGYVKDDDKDKIDADALLTQLKEGTEAANKEREKHGWTKVHVLGWESPPAYDEQTHTLGWAVRGQTEGSPGESINYFTRLLGRHGVMSVELVAGADVYGAALVEFRKALKGYSFQPGKTYAEYRKGDAVAGIGLAALIAGGAGAAAMKSGLLAKFWKAIVAAVLALAAAVKSLFSRLFGRGRDEVIEPPAGSTVPPAAS